MKNNRKEDSSKQMLEGVEIDPNGENTTNSNNAESSGSGGGILKNVSRNLGVGSIIRSIKRAAISVFITRGRAETWALHYLLP
ncbi:hypothetical protein Bca52824_001060 [Brassica carinata]|uniref:Uncharacterized protein n=1 Tax=Brassica carinata TaxID=52824 RepID=A0A8X7WJE5_BRACI|nr:hypothetical protein Bca52824_001060 [Brassica carinata]